MIFGNLVLGKRKKILYMSSTVVVHLSDQAVRGSIIGAFFRQAPNVSAI